MKPFYKLEDFENLKTSPGARNYMATCPECGKHHLSISKENGLFHCFTPGCEFNGKLKSASDSPEGEHWMPGGSLRANKMRAQHSVLPLGGVRGGLPGHALSTLESNPGVVRYLEEQQIPLEVARKAGCMAAERTLEGVKHNCLAYVNRLYGNIINVKFRAVDKKLFTQETLPKEAGVPQAPYNIECLNPLLPTDDGQDRPDMLILTEGEKDVLSVQTALFGGYWWLPKIKEFPIAFYTEIQLLTKSCPKVGSSRGTKMGQNLLKTYLAIFFHDVHVIKDLCYSFAKVHNYCETNEGNPLNLSFAVHFSATCTDNGIFG